MNRNKLFSHIHSFFIRFDCCVFLFFLDWNTRVVQLCNFVQSYKCAAIPPFLPFFCVSTDVVFFLLVMRHELWRLTGQCGFIIKLTLTDFLRVFSFLLFLGSRHQHVTRQRGKKQKKSRKQNLTSSCLVQMQPCRLQLKNRNKTKPNILER